MQRPQWPWMVSLLLFDTALLKPYYTSYKPLEFGLRQGEVPGQYHVSLGVSLGVSTTHNKRRFFRAACSISSVQGTGSSKSSTLFTRVVRWVAQRLRVLRTLRTGDVTTPPIRLIKLPNINGLVGSTNRERYNTYLHVYIFHVAALFLRAFFLFFLALSVSASALSGRRLIISVAGSSDALARFFYQVVQQKFGWSSTTGSRDKRGRCRVRDKIIKE